MQYFPENPPARATFAVKVPPGCLLSRFVLGVELQLRLVDTPPSAFVVGSPTSCTAALTPPCRRLPHALQGLPLGAKVEIEATALL